MAKLIALLFLAALIAVAASQYLGAYPRAYGYAGLGAPLLARGAYAPFGAGYPGYLGYGARGVVLG